jgi:hypothetical protein
MASQRESWTEEEEKPPRFTEWLGVMLIEELLSAAFLVCLTAGLAYAFWRIGWAIGFRRGYLHGIEEGQSSVLDRIKEMQRREGSGAEVTLELVNRYFKHWTG